MTIVLTPYWCNGVQKLRVAHPCKFLSRCHVRIPSYLLSIPPVYKAVLQAPKHGLVPPAYDPIIHLQRCLMQLRSKGNNLEKYIYLSHLKNEDPPTFYKLCLQHMPEITPIIYTPTVGDACLNFSHIYRRPEGLVRI
jgi:malate dehydrogenase (oxaloacetate-decarboxylating)(NADP+)